LCQLTVNLLRLGGAQYLNEIKCVVKLTHLSAEYSAVLGGFSHLFSKSKITLSCLKKIMTNYKDNNIIIYRKLAFKGR